MTFELVDDVTCDGLAHAAAAGPARQIGELFTGHVSKENDVVLPTLVASHDSGARPKPQGRPGVGAADPDGAEHRLADRIDQYLLATAAHT